MKALIILIGLSISVYFLIAALLFFFQRNFLYFPTENYAHTLTVEQFSNANERVEVMVLNESKDNAMLYFGGNGESMLHSSPGLANAFPGHTLYLVNYRGYGGSSGKPTEKALYSDAQYIYDVLAKRHANLSVIGRSLGSGIATFLAATRTIDKIILITPYDSIQRIAQDKFPFFPMSILLKDKYDSAGRVKEIRARALVILAEHDRVIPLKYSTRLIEEFPQQQIIVKTILGADHNNLSNTDEYYSLLRNFMR